jgi:hypothetical protein
MIYSRYLPVEYRVPSHHALNVGIDGLFALIRPPGKGVSGFTADEVVHRILFETGQGGEGIGFWEISRWVHRGTTEAAHLSGSYSDSDILVWTNEDPPDEDWHVYSEGEFIAILLAAMKIFVNQNPDRRQEYSKAMLMLERR